VLNKPHLLGVVDRGYATTSAPRVGITQAANPLVSESVHGPELDLEHELVGKVSTFCAKACSEEMDLSPVIAGLDQAIPIMSHGRAPLSGMAGSSPAMTIQLETEQALTRKGSVPMSFTGRAS
jgi:hypothetical protein